MKLCFIFPEFQKTEKGKEENIKRRKIYFLRRRNLLEKENVTIADTHIDRQTDIVKIGLEFAIEKE